MSKVTELRSWKDAREVGPLSRLTPLQSSLSLEGLYSQSTSLRTFNDFVSNPANLPSRVTQSNAPNKKPYRDNIDNYYNKLSVNNNNSKSTHNNTNSSSSSSSSSSSNSMQSKSPKIKFNSKAVVSSVLGGVYKSTAFSDTSNGSSSSIFDGLISGSSIISIANEYAAPPTAALIPASSSSTSSSSYHHSSTSSYAIHDLTGNSDLHSHSKINGGSNSSNEQISKKQAGGNNYVGSGNPSGHSITSANSNITPSNSSRFSGNNPDQKNTLYNKLLNNSKRVDHEDQSESSSNADPSKSKYGFSSAKTIFVKDGGKIENISNNNNNSNNRNNNSTSMSNIGKKLVGNNNNSNRGGGNSGKDGNGGGDDELPEGLQGKGLDKALVDKIESDIIQNGQPVTFEQIAGLKTVKDIIREIIIWPMLRPDLFVGLRSLPRGLLLFGPPGTGKTLIGKAVAHETGATFFSISASSLTSKWIGEGERMVKTLFAVAVYREPSVVFIDEVDSLLCQRSEGENEATRRMKTEIFIQLDGANTNADARVILIGATNRPDELDEAARRRFQKRIYIPLPDEDGRRQLFDTQLDSNPHSLYLDDINELVELTKGYSGADIRLLLTEAAMGPMREMAKKFGNNVTSIREADIPQINRNHFDDALENVAPSVSQADLQKYIEWNSIYGSSNRKQGGATSN